MSNVNNKEIVNQQYRTDKNLATRIALHQKYSTNLYGYTNWMFDQYEFFEGCKVLELGCGNGELWSGRIENLPSGTIITLSDISAGMLEAVRERYKDYTNVSTELIDIQEINYPDCTFNIIIANSMLYHIPDLPKAISEVHRVLKPEGKFYATTLGNNGMREYLYQKFQEFNPSLGAFKEGYPFHLQNGRDTLERYFTDIKVVEYEDSLEITETSDLIDWIRSTTLMSRVGCSELTGLSEFFEKCKDDKGIIRIPKETGMFISVKH